MERKLTALVICSLLLVICNPTSANNANADAVSDGGSGLVTDMTEEEEDNRPVYITNWINSVLPGGHLPSDVPSDIQKRLRDGVILCKLINTLLESEGKRKAIFAKKVMSPRMAYSNINNYNSGCQSYGLSREDIVQPADLWSREGQFLNVINNIHNLGILANSKGFTPPYAGEIS